MELKCTEKIAIGFKYFSFICCHLTKLEFGVCLFKFEICFQWKKPKDLVT